MEKIFISYNHQDTEFVKKLQKVLKDIKLAGFLDKQDIAAGANLSDTIRKSIGESSAVIVLLSKHSMKSKYIMFEIGLAQALGKRIIPIRLPNTELDEDFINSITDIQTLDASKWSIKEIKNKLRSVLEKVPLQKLCFVLVPSSTTDSNTLDEWTEIYHLLIKPAVEESGFNYTCERATPIHGNIVSDLVEKLNSSDLVIADLTDRNPDVLYSLGVRHTIGNPTLIISQNLNNVPFDLRPYATVVYGWKTKKERADFRAKIKVAITQIEDDPTKFTSPIKDYLKSM